MKPQLYIKKGRRYLPIDNKLSKYEEDCIWMSYRYCIGRHTIAAHMHAGEIAANAYGRMSDERMKFMSKDINREIERILNVNDWFTIDMSWSVPRRELRPLDVLYQCLDGFIQSDDDLRDIKDITAYYDPEGWDFYTCHHKEGHHGALSLSDLHDLEPWQRLANLFDLDGHKWCRLIDGTICEYYEIWEHSHELGKIRYRKYRVPVDAGFSTLTCIPDESIAEDNVVPIKENYNGSK